MINPAMSDRIKYRFIFHGFNFLIGLYIIPLCLFAYINPFWFRKNLMRFIGDHYDYLTTIRTRLLKPIVAKYKKA